MDWELVTSSEQSYILQDGATVGRSSEATIALQDGKASRQHAQFRVRGDSVMVRDLNSTNGTYVNRVRITAPVALKSADQIRIGNTTLTLHLAGAPREALPVLENWAPMPAPPYHAQPDRSAEGAWLPPHIQPPSLQNAPHSAIIVCPNCGRGDNVQTAARSGLAGPTRPSDTPLRVVNVIFWAMVVLASVVTVIVIGTSLFGGAVYDSLLPGLGMLSVLGGLVTFCFFIPIMALWIGIPWFIRRHFTRKYAGELATWEHAQEKWSELRYCNTCAGAFLPGQHRLIPVEQLQSFLFGLSRD
jgi:pSer/pThr/pTyr-binding forkhead associated (FHA) protein